MERERDLSGSGGEMCRSEPHALNGGVTDDTPAPSGRCWPATRCWKHGACHPAVSAVTRRLLTGQLMCLEAIWWSGIAGYIPPVEEG